MKQDNKRRPTSGHGMGGAGDASWPGICIRLERFVHLQPDAEGKFSVGHDDGVPDASSGAMALGTGDGENRHDGCAGEVPEMHGRQYTEFEQERKSR
ncbi:MAG TPA: hypothetical protein VJ698_13060 [Noviherbaspirillum sp.]|nr:hypothetical protein [Noviherbaspirillum sp.]